MNIILEINKDIALQKKNVELMKKINNFNRRNVPNNELKIYQDTLNKYNELFDRSMKLSKRMTKSSK